MAPSAHAARQIHYVTNFNDLVATPFSRNVNAIGWPRELAGDFSEIVAKLETDENMIAVEPEKLRGLQLCERGQLARDVILRDLQLLTDHGAQPTLNLIGCYERDDSYPSFPTDVYSFHVDRAPLPGATFLCTYHGATSDIVPNDQATQKVLIPEIRAELRELYGGADEGFEAFLRAYFFDLHYQTGAGADITNLGVGHLWRLAIDHPGSKTLPCIHRAPRERAGEPRLMVIC